MYEDISFLQNNISVTYYIYIYIYIACFNNSKSHCPKIGQHFHTASQEIKGQCHCIQRHNSFCVSRTVVGFVLELPIRNITRLLELSEFKICVFSLKLWGESVAKNVPNIQILCVFVISVLS